MLDVPAALEIVLQHAKPLPAASTSLSPSLLGRVLAESIPADLDSPPFTKAMMDGYAIRAADAGEVLYVVGQVAAGEPGAIRVSAGEAARIFTGAPIPDGADAVVMQEFAEPVGENRIRITKTPVKPGQHIIPRGHEMRAGDSVLSPGAVLTPVALGLLAAVGRTEATVHPVPRVGVLATGTELVEPPTVPGPGQIRNSNGPMLAALVAKAGADPRTLGIASDNAVSLRKQIREGLDSSDILVLAGGVSVGVFDLVPAALQELRVAIHFHKIRMKPGKPLLFGTHGNTLVFGLPGNPVSALVGFELFVRPAIRVLCGHREPGPVIEKVPLANDFAASNDRPTYHPAKRVQNQIHPLPWFGSADLRALAAANALMVLPPGDVRYAAGEWIEVVALV